MTFNDFHNALRERVAREMFDVGHADAHGPDIYEEQADWWRDCARAAIEVTAVHDLYAALTDLLHETELAGNATANDYGWPTAVPAARAALAKARGETP